MCMRRILDLRIIEALQVLVKRLKGTDIKWVLVGSVSLALQGVKVEPGDIDILTDRDGAYGIADLLKKHETKPVKFSLGKWSRSFFGEFEIRGVKIEVMSDLEERIGSMWVSLSDRLVSPKLVQIDRIDVPVSSLEAQLESYRLSNRKQDKIRSQKIQESLKNRCRSKDLPCARVSEI